MEAGLSYWRLHSDGIAKWSRCAELTADRAGLSSHAHLRRAFAFLVPNGGGYSEGVRRRTNMNIAAFIKQAPSEDSRER